MSNINSSEISIVVQGPVLGANDYSSEKGVTYDCLKALRKVFPDAEIILSTWKDSDTHNLTYDKLILNDDPGAHVFADGGILNSNNRIIVSSQNGINAVERKYCLKLRSDVLIISDDFLKYFEKFPKRTGKFNLFKHKIICNSLFSYKYFKKENKFMFCPFHVSDWILFGLTEDLKTLLDIPLAIEPAHSEYFKNNKRPNNKIDFFTDAHWKYSPEQYVFYNALKIKYPNVKFDHKLDVNYTLIKQVEHAVLNNFIFLEPSLWKFYLLKWEYYEFTRYPESLPDFLWPGMYKLSFNKKMYNKLLNENLIIFPSFYEIRYSVKKFVAKHLRFTFVNK